ncbi:MATE family efflux transporter [Myroides odoratimimus]|uniref:MATE family efflux transporter n=1 Tax=Myroides odoratimimus TaxID=76832 RepID=UPI0029C08341|nr:MATE family efflux transporter [Myroides odoratimimus]MDX4973960.1 MATE family efflux transporter [Myroides odoratimimus]
MERDAIDFGKMDISKLFIKIFVPTLLGLMSGATVYLADGIFVGNGVGSDALAAVNIASPLFLIATGIALMFGSGVSIVVAIHLSRGRYKAANINITQALLVSVLLMLLISIPVFLFTETIAYWFGSSEKLLPLVVEYLVYVLPSFLGSMILVVGMFIIRLDGAPKFAMASNLIASILNILLVYIFVFPFEMGLKGAAIATSISQCIGAVIVIIYMLWFTKTLRLCKIKLSKTSIRLTIRNIGYMVKLGGSAFIGETALACTMIIGNILFMGRLQEDGVAAFSVACYLMPLVFMFGNAISQSALPIISYNYGLGNTSRIKHTFKASLKIAISFGIIVTLAGIFAKSSVISIFIKSDENAHDIATSGFPYYSLSFIFLLVNLVLIGYLQSLERFKPATIFMFLRSYIFVIPSFILLPQLFGNKGLWLAVPVAEFLTFIIIVFYLIFKRKKNETISMDNN